MNVSFLSNKCFQVYLETKRNHVFKRMINFSNSVWVQLLDRKQQRLELVLIPLDNFCEPLPNVYNSENHYAHTAKSNVQVLYSETSPIWINVNDLLYFLPSNDPMEVKFIWGSEESKFCHLYLITSSLTGECDKIHIFLTSRIFVSCPNNHLQFLYVHEKSNFLLRWK